MKDTLTRPGVEQAACLWGVDLILLASFWEEHDPRCGLLCDG